MIYFVMQFRLQFNVVQMRRKWKQCKLEVYCTGSLGKTAKLTWTKSEGRLIAQRKRVSIDTNRSLNKKWITNSWRFQSSYDASGTTIRNEENILVSCTYGIAVIMLIIIRKKFLRKECHWNEDIETSLMTH